MEESENRILKAPMKDFSASGQAELKAVILSKYGDRKETPSEETLENTLYFIFLFPKVVVRLTQKSLFCIPLFARNLCKFL